MTELAQLTQRLHYKVEWTGNGLRVSASIPLNGDRLHLCAVERDRAHGSLTKSSASGSNFQRVLQQRLKVSADTIHQLCLDALEGAESLLVCEEILAQPHLPA